MAFGGPAAAQDADPPPLEEPSGALTLEHAVALAIERGPELRAAELGLATAEGKRLQAGLRSNPEAGFEIENLSGDLPGASESELTLSVAQRLELGGKRGARVALADSLQRLARVDLEVARRDLERDVTSAFAAGLGAQARVAVAEETLALAREVTTSVEHKVEAGAVSPVEVTRAGVAVAQAEVQLETARREAELTRRLLALRWGSPAPGFASLGGELDTLATVPAWSALSERLGGNPDVARWAAESQSLRARLDLERTLGKPDLTLDGGVRRLEESGSTTFVAGFGIPLPLFDRNQGAVKEAGAALDQAARRTQAARLRAERELLSALVRLEIEQARVRGLRSAVIPGAEATFTEIRRGYELGKFTYLDVLEARRALAEARAEEIEALVTLRQAQAEAESLIGGSL
jgi:cobalt-zinc-cadmium efflux system outer membrane protein